MSTINISTARDWRCPYCGRPVLGIFVQGVEGRYHPECTRPPDYPPFVVPVPPWWDNQPQWGIPNITCKNSKNNGDS